MLKSPFILLFVGLVIVIAIAIAGSSMFSLPHPVVVAFEGLLK